MQEHYQFPPNQQQQFVHQQQPFVHQQQPAVQHVVVLQIPMEDHPVNTSCPSCHQTIVTTVTTEANAYTHLFAGILCLMCCIPCAIIPYCCSTSQSSIHTCPNCSAYIGTYNPFHSRGYRRW